MPSISPTSLDLPAAADAADARAWNRASVIPKALASVHNSTNAEPSKMRADKTGRDFFPGAGPLHGVGPDRPLSLMTSGSVGDSLHDVRNGGVSSGADSPTLVARGPLFDRTRVRHDPAAEAADRQADESIKRETQQRTEAATNKWLDSPIKYTKPTYSVNQEPRPGDAPRYIGPNFDQSNLHLQDFPDPDAPVNMYRVEVREFSSKFGHVHLGKDDAGRPTTADLHIPGHAAASARQPFARDQNGAILRDNAGKPIPLPSTPERLDKRDPAFPDKYVEQHRGDKGNKSWLNAGNPYRALEFKDKETYRDIAEGLERAVKTYQTEGRVVRKIQEDAVHERFGAALKDKPINVDRAEPNQFGLPPAYAKLTTELQVPGTGRELSRDELEWQIGTPFWTPDGTPYTTAGPTRMNSVDWNRDKGLPFGPSRTVLKDAVPRTLSTPSPDDLSLHQVDLSDNEWREPTIFSLPEATPRRP